MARIFENYLGIIMALLMCIVISILSSESSAIIYPTMAQASGAENSTTPMRESASFHLKAADRLLMEGNTEAALDQINLAEIQLSLLNMASQENSMNQTQAMEFII